LVNIDGLRGGAYDARMNRTPAYWSTRIMLAAGIAAVLLAGVILVMEPTTMTGGPRMVEKPFVLAAFLVMVVGLVWMVRIFRGPRDEAPAWRHRDR
jgi:hypothetical protein